MATISELIRSEADGTISFGDYTLGAKAKLDNFEHQGDIYKVKTFSEITKLERNGMFVYESVPGTAVMNLNATDTGLTFQVEGPEDAQITVELELYWQRLSGHPYTPAHSHSQCNAAGDLPSVARCLQVHQPHLWIHSRY